MRRTIGALAVVAMLSITTMSATAVDIIWDGGDGEWNDFIGKWNGGQTSDAVFGRNDGLEVGGAEIGTDIFINDGNVTYNPNLFGDFRVISETPGVGSLTIGAGASLSMDTNFDEGGDIDGQWTQFNADTLNLDGGTIRRTFSGGAESGGLFSFGGIRSHPNLDAKINITNGGRIENDGQLTFGWFLQGGDAVGRKVTMTINDGHLDLTGGDNFDALGGAAGGAGNADLHFQYAWDEVAGAPAGEEYAINFTGPGSITVDHSGILVIVQTGPGDQDFDFDTILNVRTYEDLWDMGILQANGLSGVDGETFGDYFSVTGEAGMDDYVLTRVVDSLLGDFDKDGDVDGDDFLAWQANFPTASGATQAQGDADGDGDVDGDDFLLWQADFPSPGAGGGSSAVPEPSAALLVTMLASLAATRRRVR